MAVEDSIEAARKWGQKREPEDPKVSFLKEFFSRKPKGKAKEKGKGS